jgi:hypothetical protein
MRERMDWGADLLPLRRMAARLGVPSKWLREHAESGAIPALHAGNRWLFRPDVVGPIVAKMAEGNAIPSTSENGGEAC